MERIKEDMLEFHEEHERDRAERRDEQEAHERDLRERAGGAQDKEARERLAEAEQDEAGMQ